MKQKVYGPEYHTVLFACMQEPIMNNFQKRRDKIVNEIVNFYTRSHLHLSGKQGDDAIYFITVLQERLEIELKNIISKKGIYYWFHLYRRIAPFAGICDETKHTVLLYRNILEAAFLKFGKVECGDEIIYGSEEKPVKICKIASGFYLDALKALKLEKFSLKTMSGIFLGKFDYDSLMEIYVLERIAFEFWHTTMCARRIYKSGTLTIKEGIYYVNNDDETERLMKFYDERHDTQDLSSSDGILLNPLKYSNGSSFIAKYNVELLSLKDYPQDKLFVNKFKLKEDTIPNFLWLPHDFNYYYITHAFFDKEFQKAYGYSIKCFTFLLYIICLREIYFCLEDERLVGLELLKRAYRHFNNIDKLVEEITFLSQKFKLPSLKDYELNKEEVCIALKDLSLKQDRINISLVTLGPRALLFPSINNGFNIDYAAIYYILFSKTHFLRPKTDEKGYLFEDEVIYRLQENSFLLWHCKRKLRHSDGTKKEIDISFTFKDLLFVGELKANTRSINYIEGTDDTLAYRKQKMLDAVQQVEAKADWLLNHKKGANYEIPCNINIIIPFVVTPYEEYIWSEDKNLWLTDEIPRICTPSECCKLCDEKLISQIMKKPYLRLVK